MVYRIKHINRVARGFEISGSPVAHDHAHGAIPLEQHTRDLSQHETEKESSNPNKIISIIGNSQIDARDILVDIQKIVLEQSLQDEFLGVSAVMLRKRSVVVIGSDRLAHKFARAGMCIDVSAIPEGLDLPKNLARLKDENYFTRWGFKE